MPTIQTPPLVGHGVVRGDEGAPCGDTFHTGLWAEVGMNCSAKPYRFRRFMERGGRPLPRKSGPPAQRGHAVGARRAWRAARRLDGRVRGAGPGSEPMAGRAAA